MPFSEDPRIITLFEKKHNFNPISGHSWTEYTDKAAGYEVIGGGWMRSKHTRFSSALRELELRKQILRERRLRGE